MRAIASVAGPIDLETVPKRVSIEASGGKTLASFLEALGPGQRLYLVLHGLRAKEQPGVLYHLYLNLPPGTKPGADDARYMGTFNFYDAIPIGDEKGTAPPSSGFNSYDITELARTLRGRGLLSEPTTVTIQPGGTPAPGAKPVIGRIGLIVQ